MPRDPDRDAFVVELLGNDKGGGPQKVEFLNLIGQEGIGITSKSFNPLWSHFASPDNDWSIVRKCFTLAMKKWLWCSDRLIEGFNCHFFEGKEPGNSAGLALHACLLGYFDFIPAGDLNAIKDANTRKLYRLFPTFLADCTLACSTATRQLDSLVANRQLAAEADFSAPIKSLLTGGMEDTTRWRYDAFTGYFSSCLRDTSSLVKRCPHPQPYGHALADQMATKHFLHLPTAMKVEVLAPLPERHGKDA